MSQEHQGARPPSTHAQRLEELKYQVALRLRPVCPSMPAEDFERMVEKIAAVELKYDYGGGVLSRDRRA